LENFEICELDKGASEIFAKEKARLKKRGLIIADMDLMIASIAIAHGLPLVTNNHKHFERIKGLRLIRWVKSNE
jgi:tRNA(fMet)-specific endonuclease VapC